MQASNESNGQESSWLVYGCVRVASNHGNSLVVGTHVALLGARHVVTFWRMQHSMPIAAPLVVAHRIAAALGQSVSSDFFWQPHHRAGIPHPPTAATWAQRTRNPPRRSSSMSSLRESLLMHQWLHPAV